MDVISLSKATKAKKAIKKLQDRLGMNGTEQGKDVRDIYANVKTRLEELEKKDPHITLYNRVSEVEANTAINLNKHNLHINSILNKNKYGLTDLAFDDFGDDSGIDHSKSTGHEFDAVGRKVKIASGQTQAEVVTTAEETNVVPRMITVSQAFNEVLTGERQVDLVNGVHANTEIVNGKIQLKALEVQNEGIYTSDVVPKMTSNNSNGIILSRSSVYNSNFEAYKMFDDSSSDTTYGCWTPAKGAINGSWVSVDFGPGNEKIIKKYSLSSSPRSDAGARMAKSWRIEGSNDNMNWTVLDFQSNQSGWGINERREYLINNNTAYRYYRIYILENNGDINFVQIGEMELMESKAQNLYSPTGTYESPVLDLGDNFKDIVKIDQIIDIPSVTAGQTAASVKLYTSTSSDNITFSDWQPVNPDGTITSPSARYIKVKVELIGGGEIQEKTIYDFASAESANFQNNDKVIFNDSLKLKTQYIDTMTVDTSFTDTGTLLRKSIEKASFKAIEKVEVN
jgi:hypothetical protein